jgi:ectoine hydroxylase-related dioxygenase (phytanoyl-CoA dioxygenase family)
MIAKSCFNSFDYAMSFHRDGYFICDDVLSLAEVEKLRAAVSALPDGEEVRRKNENKASIYGVRNLFDLCPAVVDLARTKEVLQFVTPVIGDGAFAVRAFLFDKVPDANWSLVWHQDLMIAVRERIETPGYGPWSRKAGVWQVQPPKEILANMVAVRIHLDDCHTENGPLRVLPGSHREGNAGSGEVICNVGIGGVVTMCPLTLHASSASTSPNHRRVIHIEYAANELPNGLEWYKRIESK